MQVLILAAGYGTRLYPLTLNTPKPLLPIRSKPIVDYLLDKVKDVPDLSQVVVVTNDKFTPHFEAWAKQHKDFQGKIRIVNDGTKTNEDRLGSMGDIHLVIKELKLNEDLLVLGGDNLFDQDLKTFIQESQKRNGRASIGLFDIHDRQAASKFGVVALDEKNQISSFEEKPKQPKSSLIGMCVYYFPKQTLNKVETYLKEEQKSDTSGDYIKWLSEKEEVYGFTFQGKWYDIGSLEAYEDAQKSFREK